MGPRLFLAGRGLFRGQKGIDLLLEDFVFLRTFNDIQDLDLVATWNPAPEQVPWRAADAEVLGGPHVFTDSCRVLPTGKALLEGGHVQAELFGIARKPLWREGALVLEQEVVHVPEHLLVTSACRRLRGLEGIPVEWKGQIEIDELDCASANELFIDLG